MKAGDVVELKSGGPKMAIDSVFMNGSKQIATCVWFDGTNNKSANFNVETLQAYKAPDFSGIG